MKRAKKMVLLAHCILNVNAKVMEIATVSAGCTKLVSSLLEQGYGIIQLPCMEQHCCGSNRWGQVSEQLNFPSFRRQCRELLTPVVDQVEDFCHNDYQVAAVVGLDGSPACGVNRTCTGPWGGELGHAYGLDEKIAALGETPKMGVMMQVLQTMLKERGLDIPFIAVDEGDPDLDAGVLLAQLT